MSNEHDRKYKLLTVTVVDGAGHTNPLGFALFDIIAKFGASQNIMVNDKFTEAAVHLEFFIGKAVTVFARVETQPVMFTGTSGP